MQATKALLLSNMLSSSESVEDAEIATFVASCVSTPDISVDLEPIQDLHGYDNPWPAGGGVNKLLPSDIDASRTVQGVTANWSASNEELTLNGSNSGSYTIVIDFTQENGHIRFPDLQVGDTWSLSANLPTGSYIGIVYKSTSNTEVQYWYIAGNDTYKKITRTVPNDFASFRRVQIGINPSASFSNAKIKIAFESGSGSATWTPYSNICTISGRSEVNVYVEESYDPQATPKATIQLGQTVYGGTVDVTSGKLVIDRAMKVFSGDSSEGWSKSDYGYFSTPRINDAINRNATSSDFQSNLFAYAHIINNSSTLGACLIWATVRVRIADMSISLDDWKAKLTSNPMQVVYTLATPVEVTLTPQQIQTLVGENNVWSDSGNISVRNITCNADFLDLFLKLKLIGDC